MTSVRYRRSRFSLLTWEDDHAIWMNGNTLDRRVIHPKLVLLLCQLGNWIDSDALSSRGIQLSTADLEQLCQLGLLEREGDAACEGAARFEWDPLELAVQRRTASGHALRTGEPPPFTRRLPDAGVWELPTPRQALEPSFTDVLQRRRSRRRFADRPIELQALSSLLHHAAQVRHVWRDAEWGERELRPFPTAGARSELELYLLVQQVEGLEPGAYHYQARQHRLAHVRGPDAGSERMLASVRRSTGMATSNGPPLVVLITAVFERTLWKYRNMGLSLIYKDVGGLIQTLYLVATALDLAACAVGNGEEAENSRWLGLTPLHESQVGCVIFGAPGEAEACASTA